jgi:hypothetical protein
MQQIITAAATDEIVAAPAEQPVVAIGDDDPCRT